MEGVFCCKLTFPHPHSGWFYVSHALRTQLTKVNNIKIFKIKKLDFYNQEIIFEKFWMKMNNFRKGNFGWILQKKEN